MTTDQSAFSSPASEQRVISFLNLEGAQAMGYCAAAGVTPDAFTQAACRAIFEAASDLHARQMLFLGGEILGEEVVVRRKVMSFADYVENTRQLPAFGVAPMEMPQLCRELKRLEKRRKVRGMNDTLALALKDGDAEKTAAAMSALSATEITDKPRATWQQIGGVEIDRAKAIIAGTEDPDVRSIPWPWPFIDKALKPFRRGELVIVAGYTAMGKSSLLRQLCLHPASRGYNIAFASLEVPAGDIFNLMTSAHSGQPWSRLKNIHPRDQAEFIAAGQQVRGMSIDVLDDGSSLPVILAWLRNMHSRKFLDVVAIDYLGLVSECSPQRGQSKASAVGEVAGAFKRLASELQIVLFLAVQINRSPTQDGNREPRLSDLKDSGDIEAHADRVLLIYRPDKSIDGTEQSQHETIMERPRFYTELFQEKGRNVGTGQTPLWFRRELARFELVTDER